MVVKLPHAIATGPVTEAPATLVAARIDRDVEIRQDLKTLVHRSVAFLDFSSPFHIGLAKAQVNVETRIGLRESFSQGNQDDCQGEHHQLCFPVHVTSVR
jgi:hypothetical protein